MAIISRLAVILGLDSGEFNAGLGKAEGKLSGFKGGVGATGIALGALGAAFSASAIGAAKFADQIDEVATANEISIGTVLKLSEALTLAGGKSEDAGRLFASFSNKIEESLSSSGKKGRESFEKLGVTLNDLQTLDSQDLFGKTLQGLAKIEDPLIRNARAAEVFGKAVKGVDIVGLNEEFQNNKKNYEAAEKSFKDIAAAMDILDRQTFKLKIALAENIGPAFKNSLLGLEAYMAGLDKLSLKQRAVNALLSITPFGAISTVGTAMTQGAGSVKEPIKPEKQTSEIKRQAEALNEVTAAATKLSDEYAKQKLSLKQQSLELDRQLKSIGQQQTGAEKLALEFEKGGKYARLKGTADEKAIMNQQRQLDLANQQYERAQELAKQAIKQEEVERAAREARAKEVAQMAIQKMEHDRAFGRTVQELDFAKERLDLEKTMAGQADVKVNKALSLFDLEKEILRLKRDDKLITEEQIDLYRQAGQARIEADEANIRAQHTFQAGWSKAYNNFAERASDSAALGAEAFNSMTRNMESALDTFVRTGKLSFKDFAASVIQDLLMIQLKAQATGLFSSLFGGMFGGGDGGGIGLFSSSTDFANGGGIMGFLGFANGGEPPVGVPSIVGERGPELFVPKTSGTIVPNHSLSSAMGQQPKVVYNGPYIANMSTIDSKSFEERIYQSSNAVWAANAYANKSMPTTGGRT